MTVFPDAAVVTPEVPKIFKTPATGTAVAESVGNESGIEPVTDAVRVLVPGLPVIVMVVPSPTTLILFPVGGTAPPEFPVKVSVFPAPELILIQFP